ncbi:hypothetical protein OIO90_000402 [Microbotryomycetes sp. JL221]|nr:hypothetical protein OIO90_000402 [Microbotryomycetes sp. JL221]
MSQANFLQARLGMPIWSRRWDPSEMADLDGKVALVTGGNTGIGYHTCAELIRKGCRVYMACRSEQRARDAIERLSKDVPDSASKVAYLPFDLTELKSAKKAAETLKSKEQRLDIVICNAGIMAWPFELKNGIEIQFYNHLGHFALVTELLSLLEKTAQEPDSHVRVVSVSSTGHQITGTPDFSSTESVNRQMTSTWHRYGQSKLSNILFANGLQKRVYSKNIRCLSLHPGVVYTELTRGPVASAPVLGHVMRILSSWLAMTPAEGAKTQLYAAASPEVDDLDLKAAYLTPIAAITTPSAYARDDKLAEDLWRLSEQIVRDALRA